VTISCAPCRHPQRAELEAALRRGDSFRRVARTYRLALTTLHRHAHRYVPEIARARTEPQAPPGSRRCVDCGQLYADGSNFRCRACLDHQRAPADLFRPEFVPQKSDTAMPVRLQAVQQWLGRQVGGEESALLIDPGCMQLALAFGGAYQWRQSGGRVMPGVVANAAASLMDAFSYALARVTATGQLDARLRRKIMGPKVLIPS
jgi:hypothetical protein